MSSTGMFLHLMTVAIGIRAVRILVGIYFYVGLRQHDVMAGAS